MSHRQERIPIDGWGRIFFDLITPHFWSNVGNEVAEILFTSPNSFHLFEQVENDVRWHVSWKRQKRRTKTVKRLVQVATMDAEGGSET